MKKITFKEMLEYIAKKRNTNVVDILKLLIYTEYKFILRQENMMNNFESFYNMNNKNAF